MNHLQYIMRGNIQEFFTPRSSTNFKSHPSPGFFSFSRSSASSCLYSPIMLLCEPLNPPEKGGERLEYWVSAANGTRSKRAIGKWLFFFSSHFYWCIVEVFNFLFSSCRHYFFLIRSAICDPRGGSVVWRFRLRDSHFQERIFNERLITLNNK